MFNNNFKRTDDVKYVRTNVNKLDGETKLRRYVQIVKMTDSNGKIKELEFDKWLVER